MSCPRRLISRAHGQEDMFLFSSVSPPCNAAAAAIAAVKPPPKEYHPTPTIMHTRVTNQPRGAAKCCKTFDFNPLSFNYFPRTAPGALVVVLPAPIPLTPTPTARRFSTGSTKTSAAAAY